ncbi:hypothetical protein Nepgr_031385 [Nepenthes gracilis]|uniref:Protein kinase domain-containing protein n=1 Tax=Nepenthes gracilis TaxID=150966 RepID=A0AAD3THF9_NEPGR|nr:hypothetical protein Nepgr_031385 [Nepenthes gracilis]
MGENLNTTNPINRNEEVDKSLVRPQNGSPTSPKEEPANEVIRHFHQPLPPLVVAATASAAVHSISAAASRPFLPPLEAAASGGKRARCNSGQWKQIASPSPTKQPLLLQNPSPSPTTAASSSETTSSQSPSPSPRPAQDPTGNSKPAIGDQFPTHHHLQLRKGKYVSPVWKPHEMLWLARAWRFQYQAGTSGSSGNGFNEAGGGGDQVAVTGHGGGRGKSRSEKDREVAEFLKRHGVNRDAKTAGTKWDNMLGEFRKVYDWERSRQREQVAKSYFRLSPYERKLHRLPASLDEEVFEELSQFMATRMRPSSSSLTPPPSHARSPQITTFPNVVAASSHGPMDAATSFSAFQALPPPPPLPPFREEDTSLSAGKTTQMIMASEGESNLHNARGNLLGFESPLEIETPLSSSSIEIRRIGRIRMTWEESVNLWAEEGEHHRGRVKLQGSSFLNADEITYFDDTMVASTMEAFEDGPLKGFSVDRFVSGQHIKVFGRRKSPSAPPISGFDGRVQLPLTEPPSSRSISPCEYPDPTEYYVGRLRVPPPTLPNLCDLSWHIQQPPPEDLRLPLRRDMYRDLPHGKELFFTTSNEPLDCRSFTIEILSSLIRSAPSITASTATSRDSFIGLWDDCINRVISKFCSVELVFVRKPSSSESLRDQWPNLTGFVRNFCLWRGEETHQLRDGHLDPSSSIAEKILWTYADLPYVLGYYAIGHVVTFCALSRSQGRVDRTDLYSVDLSMSAERLKAMLPCWRIAGLLVLLADRLNIVSTGGNHKLLPYSDYERIDRGNGNIVEMTPNTVTKIYPSRRKWEEAKEIYDYLDRRIPHAEYVSQASEEDFALVFKPRGSKAKPTNCDQLVEALKQVTKALVALHDLSFMHRDLSWDKVMRRSGRENEWFLCGFEEATGSPQIYPHVSGSVVAAGGGRDARSRDGEGVHGVKVDVWGVGHLVKTCGLAAVPKQLKELQSRCLEQNPEQRPTAADCYHHLLQFQSSLSATAGGRY